MKYLIVAALLFCACGRKNNTPEHNYRVCVHELSSVYRLEKAQRVCRECCNKVYAE